MKKQEGNVNIDLKRYHELIDIERAYKKDVSNRREETKKQLSELFAFGALKTANSILKLKVTRLESLIRRGDSRFQQMSLVQFYKWKKSENKNNESK